MRPWCELARTTRSTSREDGVEQQEHDHEIELVVAVQGVVPEQRPRLVPRVARDHGEDPVDERPGEEGHADLHVAAAPEADRRAGPGDLRIGQQEGGQEEEGRAAEVQEHDEGPRRRVPALDVPQQRMLQHDGATGDHPERVELADVATTPAREGDVGRHPGQRHARLVRARHGPILPRLPQTNLCARREKAPAYPSLVSAPRRWRTAWPMRCSFSIRAKRTCPSPPGPKPTPGDVATPASLTRYFENSREPISR